MHRFACLLFSSLVLAQDPAVSIRVLRDARQALDSGDLATAEISVRSYLVANKESADAHFLLGYVLFKKQDPKASLVEYTEGARYRKPGAYDLEAVGCDYVLLKDYPDADKWLSKSVEWDPSNLSALYYLGRTKYNENRFDESITIFQKCLTRDPKNVKYADNLGLSYQGLGRDEEALSAYREALEWDRLSVTPNPGLYLDLGSLLLDTNRIADAIPQLERAVKLSPRDLRTHSELGKAYMHDGQLEKAQLELETAVGLETNDAPAHFVLAQIYRKRGLLEKARQESDRYRALNGERSSDKTPQ